MDPGCSQVSAKTISSQRLVLCEYERCKAADSKGKGQFIQASLRTTHVKTAAISASDISQRGRRPAGPRRAFMPSPIDMRGKRGRGRVLPVRGQRGTSRGMVRDPVGPSKSLTLGDPKNTDDDWNMDAESSDANWAADPVELPTMEAQSPISSNTSPNPRNTSPMVVDSPIHANSSPINSPDILPQSPASERDEIPDT